MCQEYLGRRSVLRPISIQVWLVCSVLLDFQCLSDVGVVPGVVQETCDPDAHSARLRATLGAWGLPEWGTHGVTVCKHVVNIGSCDRVKPETLGFERVWGPVMTVGDASGSTTGFGGVVGPSAFPTVRC
ncbi:hypothetical protein K439DRAFT_1625414 [Ramaria rubella]|nr:hypothetical protein K439DRAFT_1625414 [Ramaria rubella]